MAVDALELARLQELCLQDSTVLLGMDPFFYEETNVLALLRTLETGFQPYPEALNALSQIPQVQRVMANIWPLSTVFTDDEHFTGPRFMLLTTDWVAGHVAVETFDQAVRQACAMLRQGRLDAVYLERFMNVAMYMHANPLGTWLMAHDEHVIGNYQAWMHMVKPIQEEEYPEDWYRWDAYQHAPALRAELFREVWLPILLPADTYVKVKTLPASMLRELYSTLWDGGYGLFREQLLAAGQVI